MFLYIIEPECSPAIDRYAEELLAEIFRLALPVAIHALTTQDLTNSLSSAEAQNSLSSLEHYLQRQSSMDHLEVNFRDWCTQFRRRSSNLSDLSSRRSSCDIASRRSSACSAKGYSSEFSSEFEEYFDNFQMQDQRYKYHTIKEESGSAAVIEFASSLAASLLKQGTHEAVTHRPSPQTFKGALASDQYLKKPTPVRGLSISGDDNTVNNELIVYYVSNLVDSVWPFGNDSDLCEEIRERIMEGCRNKHIVVDVPVVVDNIDIDSDMSDSVSSRGTEYSIVEVDDEILMAVADRIVTVAFQEALLECKYSLKLTKNHICHSYSESSQSDHSMDAKDQSDSSLVDSSQAATGVTNESKNINPAMQIAEKMVSGIFSKPDSGSTSGAGGSERTIPQEDSCDTQPKVVINTIPSPHSGTHSDSMSQKQLDMYGRIADRLLQGGLASSLDISSQCNVGSEPKHSASNTLTCDPNQYSSQQHVSDTSAVTMGVEETYLEVGQSPGAVRGDNSQHTTAINTSPSNTDTTQHVCTVRIDVEDNGNSYNSASSTSKSIHSARTSSVGYGVGASGRVPNSSPDTSSSDSSGALGAVGGAIHPGSGSRHESDTPRPPSQSRIKPRPSHPFIIGNRKNYDQFANSLSRDLLTNAFLQVQEHQEFVSYPRRSSEPMQISNGAALQRLEHTAHRHNGRRSQKSKTDEDISNFDWEWNQQFSHRGSSGFRDPVLSR